MLSRSSRRLLLPACFKLRPAETAVDESSKLGISQVNRILDACEGQLVLTGYLEMYKVEEERFQNAQEEVRLDFPSSWI